MNRVSGFPAVSAIDARVLILGSMPGRASLQAGQYYAFGRNAFWKIMGELFSAGPDLAYPERLDRLVGARIALWDVLAACQRPGSLDSDIKLNSAEANDFNHFFATHPAVSHVFFNGRTAESVFRRRVVPELTPELELVALPSTSPAHASDQQQQYGEQS
jgi:hypoxanthine-DNA glycosylase